MKKGFTLIELLAVIVILAIISVIAIPTMIGVIDKAKLGALKDSAYGLIEAGTLYNAQYGNSNNARFDINNNIITTTEIKKIKYKGNIKQGVVIVSPRGNVTVCVTDGKNSAYKNYDDTEVTTVKKKTCTVPANTSVIYLDGTATMDVADAKAILDRLDRLEALILTQSENIKNNDNANTLAITATVNSSASSVSSGIPTLDYEHPLHKFTAGNLTYTATQECYLTGRITGGSNRVTINGNAFYAGTNGYNGNATSDNVPLIKLTSGDVVKLTNAQDVYVLAEK